MCQCHILGLLKLLVVIVKPEIIQRVEITNTTLPILSHEVVYELKVFVRQVEDTIEVLQDSALAVALRNDRYASAE